MRPKVYETESHGQACLKLADLIRERFGEYTLDDLVVDAVPVRRTSDNKRIATAILAYPQGRSADAIGCMWPVTEAVSGCD